MTDPSEKSLQTSSLGMALMATCAAFAIAGFLFMSLSWVIASVVITTMMVYAHERFAWELSNSRLDVKHEILSKMAFAQEPVSVKVEIRNKDHTPLRASLEDVLPEDCILGAGTNILDAKVPPRSIKSFTYSFIPTRRGGHTIGTLKITRTDQFGLFTHVRYFEDAQRLGVHTQKESFDAARKTAGKEHFEYSGMFKTPAVVLREFQFDGIREHIPGDRSRDIHWKSLSKTGKLMTKIYKKEGTLRTMIFIDCSRSMRLEKGGSAKLNHAVDLGLQLSNVLISSFHPAGVTTYDEITVTGEVRPSLGKQQFERITKVLRGVPGTIIVDDEEQPPKNETTTADHSPVAIHDRGTGSAFLNAVSAVRRTSAKRMTGLGLESVAKDMIAHTKNQKLLFIVVSDLVSSRDAVLSTARLCQRTGNRLLVIQTYDDWYSSPERVLDFAEGEQLYAKLTEGVKVESALRRAGASFMRIGPADTTVRIVRSIRKGLT